MGTAPYGHSVCPIGLVLPKPRIDKRQTVAAELRERWEILTALDNKGKRKGKIRHLVNYFGTGDQYDAEALTLWATMLGQLETEVRLINNDLTILLNKIVDAKETTCPNADERAITRFLDSPDLSQSQALLQSYHFTKTVRYDTSDRPLLKKS